MRTLLIVFFCSLVGIYAHGNHIVGANISYEHLQGENYIIFLNVFQDCSDPQQANNEILRVVPSCDFGFASYFLSLSSVTEVTQVGPLNIQNSTCNGGFLPGIVRLIYTDTIQISTTCPELVLYWKKCNRNYAVNIDNSDSPCFYVETAINMEYPENNSARLSSPTVPYVCGNPDIQVNLGAYDPDGDELRYSLVPAQRPTTGNNHVDIIYEDGFSPQEPIEGMTIDSLTGSVTMDTDIIGEYVVAMLIEELDVDGDVKSSMTVDVQFVVSSCSPYPPSLEEPGLTLISEVNAALSDSMQVSVCEGSEFCISMSFTSEDPDEILNLNANTDEVLPGASVTVSGTNPAVLDICWTATNMDGNRLLIVSVGNNDFPIPTVISYGVEIVDLSNLNFDEQPDQMVCGTEVILNNPLPIGGWDTDSGIDLNNLQNGTTSAILPSFGSYDLIWDSGCMRDTVTVTSYDAVNAFAGIDREFCDGNTWTLQASALDIEELGTWISDEGNPGPVIFSDVNDPSATITLEEFGVYDLYWQVVNPACEAIDNVTIRYNLIEPIIELVDGQFFLTNEDPFNNYQWYLNGESIPDATGSTYSPQSDQTGTFSVMATSPSDCSAMSEGITWGVTGLSEYIKNEVSIYPNPVEGGSALNIDLRGLDQALISILDARGSYILERTHLRSNGQITIPDISNGLYFIHIYTLSGVLISTKKLTVL